MNRDKSVILIFLAIIEFVWELLFFIYLFIKISQKTSIQYFVQW